MPSALLNTSVIIRAKYKFTTMQSLTEDTRNAFDFFIVLLLHAIESWLLYQYIIQASPFNTLNNNGLQYLGVKFYTN